MKPSTTNATRTKNNGKQLKTDMYKKIFLKAGKEESLKRFHPWIFSGAIKQCDPKINDGDTVEVIDGDGSYVATGHYQTGSIAVRVLSFEECAIDKDFWARRLNTALDVRKSIGLACNPNNNIFRLVHGEGDNLPGLIVDIFGKTAVMQAHSPGMHLARKDIAEALIETMDGTVENVFYKSDTTLPHRGSLALENEFIIGCNNGDIAAENGMKFHIDWLKGQKTGFFVDQRENRCLLEKYSQGRRVLNMFCYTGSFSAYAMRGRAELVHSVDSSAKAVELAESNIELNFPGDSRHKAFDGDAFKFLSNMPDAAYDLIILDPPAFAKHKGALHNALQGYKRLNAKAITKIKPGGIIFTFSCSQVVTKENFRNTVFSASAISKRNVRILHQLVQPADHPVNIYHPEGEYLKGLVLYVE